MPQLPNNRRTRIAIFTTVLLLVTVVMGAGSAAAHNPACHQTAGADGPHYDGDSQTGSQTAFDSNPTLGGDFNDEAVSSCSVGDA